MLWLIMLILGLSSQGFAWGGRGHATICQAAVHLVKEQNLKDFLSSRPHVMGHLCNIPDIYWRSLPPEISKVGDAAHFVDVDITETPIQALPKDYGQLVSMLTGKTNTYTKKSTITDVPKEFGSIWWRADQFMRRIAAVDFSSGDASLNIDDMITNMGLLGHFVGDVSQPLHNSANYDGKGTDHAGIHSYYETDVVAQFDGDLELLVLKEARKLNNPKFLKGKTTVDKMQAMSEVSFAEVKKLYALDPKPKKGKKRSAGAGFKVYRKMIVGEMARSSLLLATLWDQAYVGLSRPDLGKYKGYSFPFTPEFVPPDYIPTASTTTTSMKE